MRERFPYKFVVLALAAVTIISISSCASKQTTTTDIPPSESTEPSGDTTQEGTAVVIENDAFDPSSSDVATGSEVTWTNKDAVEHTVTSDDGLFDSGTIAESETFSFTFDEAGTYNYHCSIHPSMTGQITVE